MPAGFGTRDIFEGPVLLFFRFRTLGSFKVPGVHLLPASISDSVARSAEIRPLRPIPELPFSLTSVFPARLHATAVHRQPYLTARYLTDSFLALTM